MIPDAELRNVGGLLTTTVRNRQYSMHDGIPGISQRSGRVDSEVYSYLAHLKKRYGILWNSRESKGIACRSSQSRGVFLPCQIAIYFLSDSR
jgi:hypothetical protein